MNAGSLDLMGFFAENFKVSSIYDYGWIAVEQWTAMVSLTVLCLAASIRVVQESAALDKSDWVGAFKTVVTYSFVLACYYVFVGLLIDFFNAIYGTLNSSSSMQRLSESLNTLGEYWDKAEFEFSLSDVANSVYGAVFFVIFMITYMILVFVTFAMRVAHGLMVTLAVFWGAVAIPMSPVNGVKMLGAMKTIAITAFIWPIIDAFFMYIVSSVFADGMASALQDGGEKVTVGHLVFILSIFSIVNIFMAATSIAAPFIAQGIANGSGNVTGMLTSFAGAGVAAGAIAGKWASSQLNAAGAVAGKDGLARGNALLGGIKDPLGFGDNNQSGPTARSMVSDSKAFSDQLSPGNALAPSSGEVSEGGDSSQVASGSSETMKAHAAAGGSDSGSATPTAKSGSGEAVKAQTVAGGSDSGSATPTAKSGSGEAVKAQTVAGGSDSGSATPTAKSGSGEAVKAQAVAGGSDSGSATPTAIGAGAKLDLAATEEEHERQIREEAETQVTDDNDLAEAAKKQARRGAIINRQGKQ